jgi:hypothetical protein
MLYPAIAGVPEIERWSMCTEKERIHIADHYYIKADCAI